MHPRLCNGVSLGTLTLGDTSEPFYFVENEKEEQRIISPRIYKELMRADGTHAIRLSKPLIRKMKKDGILTTSRFVFGGAINRLILLPLGKRIARFRPVCRLLTAASPFLAVASFAAAVYLIRKSNCVSSGDLNIPLYYLFILLSMTMHEVAHLVAGISNGYRFTDMGLLLLGIFPIGAYVAHLDNRHTSRSARLQVSIAGILTNLLMAAVFLLFSTMPSPLDTTLMMAGNINVFLAILNLLPASGLDGEVALSALLGIDSVSKYSKLFLKSKPFRRRILNAGADGYACIAVFTINLITSIFVGLLIVFDVIWLCFSILF